MKKKCIIIGSGLGGLSCGVILSKNGYDVTVLEQHYQIGGCLQCFTRKGLKYETGMHFIGSAAPGQTLHKLMRYLNFEASLNLNRMDTKAYDIISLNGDRFNFANGREAFIEQMASYFPKETDNIVKYYNTIEAVAQASSLHSLKNAESDMVINTEYQTRSINEVLNSITNDRLLRNVLAGTQPLYAAEENKTPFSIHAFIMNFYNQSSYRIIGGSDTIAASLKKTIEENGGQVLTKKRVCKIECDDVKATNVITEDGTVYAADYIISTTHPARTLEWVDSKLIRPAFRQRISTMRNTMASFSVYLQFKKERVPYMNSNFYSYKSDTPWGCEIYDERSWPKGYLYMHFCNEANQQYANNGVVLSYMNMEELKEWENTYIEHRGEDYKKFKEQKAKVLIDSLEKDFPGIKQSIECYYTSTPLTYRDYTGTQDGSMYGVAKDISLGISNRVPHKTKIPNLLLSGQNINSHGILGVIVGSIVTCSELLTSETIYKQILKANL